MTQPVRFTMQDMAVLRDALLPRRDELRAAIEPFGLTTTWDATTRLDAVIDKVIEARCDLKRRQGLSLVNDSECDQYATDAEVDAWREAHPEADSEDAA